MIHFAILPLGVRGMYFEFATVLQLAPLAVLSFRQQWSLS